MKEQQIEDLAEGILPFEQYAHGDCNYRTIIYKMIEIYKAALSRTERVECYLPCPKEEGNFYIENVGWAKEVTLTVVKESDLVTSDNKSSNSSGDAPFKA